MTRRFALLNLLVMLLCISLPLTAQPSFDRLRIVITTSSDWTVLRLKGHEHIINARGSPLQGSPEYDWGHDLLSVSQPLANALAGQSVQMQFDIIVESDIATLILNFENTKGDIGTVQIDFYQFNADMPKLVASVENTKTPEHANSYTFTVDVALLLEGDFGNEFSRPSIPRLIFAFYYPWYGLEEWWQGSFQDRPLVPYSSDDMLAISHHVHLAKQAGIDGFISSWWGPWWGPDGHTDKNLQKLLTVSEGIDFKVAMYFETLTSGTDPSGAGHPHSEDEILSWMRYFFQTYGQDERFFRLEGKPVIFVWAAGTVPVDTWGRIFDTLRSEGHDAIYIANTLDPSYLEVFDGLHDYGSAFRDNIEADFQEASRATKTYGWLEGHPQFRIWAATAMPGFDDTAGVFIDRADGATYARTFEAAINSEPDWILITTFNEWPEHTYIEPSENYGSLYFELTAKYVDMFKGFKPRAPYDLRIPVISDPDGTIHLTWDSPLAQTPDSYNVYRSEQPISSFADLIPLETGLKQLTYSDLPPTDGKYYYAVTAVFGDAESPFSEVFSTISSRNKSRADPGKEIPVDIAIYTESACWISEAEADRQADLLIQRVEEKVNHIEIMGANALPEWVLSHIKNGQPDIILTFGDFPDSIYPSGNQQPDNSLAELFLDDGNIFLNTADYIFFGKGRNGEGGLNNMMDIWTNMWGDNTAVRVTQAGAKFTPSLRDFITHRPFHIDDLEGTDWEVEVSFADDGVNLADPVIVRNKKTGGRIGIIYQTGDESLPRAQIISEIILNWLPTAPPSPPWDVNADGQVDLSDLVLVGLHFGGTIDEPVSPNPDINRDGVVDIRDLVLVASHFGGVNPLNRTGK